MYLDDYTYDASSVSAVAEDGGSSGLDTPAVVPVTSCRWEVQACLSFLEAGRGSTANSKKSGCSGCVQQYKLWDLDDYLVLSKSTRVPRQIVLAAT